MEFKVLPLKGKYYGTRIQVQEGVVEVWGTGNYSPVSPREIATGWTPDYGYDHVESADDYRNACLLAAAPDLQAALSYAVDNPDFNSAKFNRLAHRALAKARGE